MEQAQKDLAGVTVTYQFGDQSEVLDNDRILSWLKEQEDGSVAIDEQQAKAFVKELAEKYDTAYTHRTFHTTGGRDIQITQGDYGWRIDQEAETKHLELFRRQTASGLVSTDGRGPRSERLCSQAGQSETRFAG